jgi:Tfp pilus assembly protein PilV
MVSCSRCGANIDPTAAVCPYCQTQTPYGYQQAQHAAYYQQQAVHAEQARADQERAQRRQALEKKSKQALIWSIAGMLVCCFPAALVGLVMGLNVKSAAKRDHISAPGSATVAVVVGVLALAVFAGLSVLYVRDTQATNARIAVLEAQVEAARGNERIDQQLGCALTELELLKEGFDGTSGINISGFECNGKLAQNGDHAQLFDVHFHTSASQPRRNASACLVRGARWSIKELREDGSCEPRAAPAASASSAR